MEEKLIVNGVELYFDLLDADVLERFTAADDVVVERLNNPDTYKDLSQADKMRVQCRIVEDFFDAMFGDGTAEKVFGKNNNHLGKHTEAFGQVMQYAQTAPDQVGKITEQYSPQRLQNREQRRAASKTAARPNTPRHYDNVRDIVAAAKPAPANNAQQDSFAAVLEEQGLTQEQFEQAIALVKSTQEDSK